ncbi:MAG: dTMP kinase [Candidatus Andersenbacteria bacterium]
MASSSRPFFVIESLDAGGGSTQLDLLVQRLKKTHYNPHEYHFPQEDSPTGQLIYEKYLHDKHRHPLSRREQALLYIQDFYSRLEEMSAIVEKGKKRDVIISDRYCTSTMAYQTIGLNGKQREEMLKWIKWLCWEGHPSLLVPTAVILLDIPVDLAMHRLEKAGRKKDIFEQRDKLTMTRRSYAKFAREENWLIVNNVDQQGRERTRQDIHEEVWGHISSRV